MPYVRHALKVLIKADRRAAIRIVKRAFILARCSWSDAATELGCGRRTYRWWARDLGLTEWLRAAARVARRQGWHHRHVGGRGKKKYDPFLEIRRRFEAGLFDPGRKAS